VKGLRKPLLIHGWGFSSEVFKNFRGLKVDLPGHGKNEKPFKGWEELLKELASITDEGHDLLGWSLGGSVALLFALRYPRKVRRLFLVGTTPYFLGAWPEKNVRALKARVRREGIGFFRRLALGEDDGEPFFPESAFPLLEAYLRLDLRPLLSNLKHEVFIIQGLQDPVVPPSEAFKLCKLIKNSKLILLGGGHLPVRDEERLKSALLESG